MGNILTNENIIFYFGMVVGVIIFASILLFISRSTERGLKKYWGELDLLKHEIFYFFIAKTSAYRRILYFFTALSYGLRIIGVLTTFFIIYRLVDESVFSNALLVLAAMCDAINLLFPFQKYVDIFSACCINMEESILQSNSKIISENKTEIYKIYEDLEKNYVECENLIHTQNKI